MAGVALKRGLVLTAVGSFWLLLMAGCANSPFLSWESSDRLRPHHSVKKGDTLYSIAWGYGLDFRQLAAFNDLAPPFTIYPGQLIRVPRSAAEIASSSKAVNNPLAPTLSPVTSQTVISSADSSSTTIPLPSNRPAVALKPGQTPTARPPIRPAIKPIKPAVSASAVVAALPQPGQWLWPHEGRVVKNWGARKHQRSGVDIAAKPGSDVRASALGKVVYSGGGLPRYGQLVILKHNDELLSAYAYNQKILVNKGQAVAAGQKIALSGRSPDGNGLVHFEVRQQGAPADVARYLKPRS